MGTIRVEMLNTTNDSTAAPKTERVADGATAEEGPIARVLSVLEAVTADDEPVSLKDVEERTGLPKATAHRILAQLESKGYLQRATSPKLFMAGPRFAAIGLAAIRNRWLHQGTSQLLANLVDRIGETCNLTVLDGYNVLVVDRVETRFPLRYVVQANARYPLFCTASGKVYLAWMSERRLSRYLEAERYEQRTERTITDRERFLEEIERVRESHYAIDNEELATGMIAVAVPIFNGQRQVIGTVSVNAAQARVSTADLIGFVPLLNDAAQRLGELA